MASNGRVEPGVELVDPGLPAVIVVQALEQRCVVAQVEDSVKNDVVSPKFRDSRAAPTN
ncbi:hypothetical protein [Microbacterium maritypicum]|uniref:hypothetical protein n=1 Tax=Microbacterium maritypicum TaxID=33918 RepID=UPI00142F1F2D|nr:hypothetical protein [Microbacterium liquefaciens]